MRSLLVLPALTVLLPAHAPAVPVTQAPLAQRVQAAPRLRADALRQLQGELALEANPAKGYYEALVAYGLVAQTMDQDPKGAEALLDQTLAALKGRKDGESLALHGALLGLKIGFAPASGMTLGPRASALFEQALLGAPESPRVRLFQGLHVLHMPEFFGGGARAARPLLLGALKAAEAEVAPKDPWAPRWGKAEALAWLAQAEIDLGQRAEAKAHVDQALALDPAYGFARFVVAPRLAGQGTR
ncbi:MAG TPA: hypothetical protein VJ623_14225 [Holophagaceae bacterium]|nr:hypothetical protein [Holophagaceae bacterium]